MPRFAPLGRDIAGRVYFAIHPGVAERDAALDLIKGSERGRSVKGAGRRLTPRRITLEDRESMSLWSWQVVVWGSLPDGALKTDDQDPLDGAVHRWWSFWQPEEITKLAEWVAIKGDVSGELLGAADIDAPAADSNEANGPLGGNRMIHYLSSSLSSSPGSDDDDAMSELSDLSVEGDVNIDMDISRTGKGELRNLVRGLQEYADTLRWRIRRWGVTAESELEVEVGKGRKKIMEGAIEPSTFYSS
jgi:hypothetical protein